MGNENPEIKGLKIVIVEDEIIIARDIKQTLENAGHEVIRMFMSGEEAAKKIPSLGADLLLLDVYLKGSLDGIEVAEIVSMSLNIPIVFITGHSEHTIISRIKFTENYGIVLKPFNTNQLLTSVELAYRNHKKKNRIDRMDDVIKHLAIDKETDFRLDSMLDLLKDINSDFRPMIKEYCRDTVNHGTSNSAPAAMCSNTAGISELPLCAHEYKTSIMTMINYADHILNDYDNLSVDEIKKFAAKISVTLKMLYAE